MDFGEALSALKDGEAIARSGWNGKNMYLYLEKFVWLTPDERYEPVIVMFTAQGKHQPGWLASQADMLAEDWSTVDPPSS